jgi:outer membrane cobalamin receptor
MHPSRLGRLAAACCPFCARFLFLYTLIAVPATTAMAATLAGKVVDPDGRPIAGAQVLVVSAIGTHGNRSTAVDGTFEIAGVTVGEYDVQVVTPGFAADPVHVVITGADRRDLDIRLHLSAISESIVVSAAQVDLPLSRTADSVTVLTAADLEARQVETIADALRLVPGLSVIRSGGRGAITSLFPRGGASDYTLVLVDGMRVNAFGGGFDFGHLAVGDVERIEIVRGPESALFGANAIGAVVQIVTRRGGRPRANGLFEGGNEGTMRAVAHSAGSHGAWSWGAGVERTQSDGYTGTAPATGERVTNDDDQLTHGSGSVEWQKPGGPDVLMTANIGRDERGFPGPFGSNPIKAFTEVDRISRGIDNTRQVGGRVTHQWSDTVRQRVDASYTNISSDFTNAFGPSFSGTGRFDGRVQEDIAFSPSVGASAGIEVLRERGSSTYVAGTVGSPIPIHRIDAGTFAEIRYADQQRLFVTGGVRLEHLRRDAVEGDPFAGRPAFADQSVNSFNPKIAVSYLLSGSNTVRQSTRLHASAGSGIRPPNAFEIAFTDNPDLKPERSRSFEAGVEESVSGGAYVVRATVFVNRYDDLLVTVGRSLQNASQYRTDNISNARARGIEFSTDLRLGSPLLLRANYTWLDTEILSVDGLDALAPAPFEVGDALIRRPRHQAAVDLTYAVGRVSAFGEVTTRSQVLDVEPSFGTFGGLFFTPGYAIANAGASVGLARGLAVYARVLNLGDRKYEETLGYPALRRSGIVGIRVGF